MDDTLLEELTQGSELAYRALFDRYYKQLANFAYRYCQDSDKAKDVVQDIFVRIYQNRNTLKSIRNLKYYLYKTVHNECLTALKKEKTRAKHHGQYNELRTDYLDENMAASEKEFRLFKAIDALPPRCREIFLMSRMEEIKNAEIAAALNISVRTVETQISIALKTLRGSLTLIVYCSFLRI
jgi:RNA polymerase sigma-70 factor, ECF subfamily